MIGNVYTRLTVESQISRQRWLCRCICGATKEVYTSGLLSGNNKSCGCLDRDTIIARNTTHGLSKDPAYSHWKEVKKRCFNKNNKRYDSYMGRGITVHPDFINDFPKWLAEIGPKPVSDERWSVGRINNDQDYTYGNMRWEIDDQQARNHTIQENNTSGIVGVAVRTTVIAGVEYPSWVACWNTLEGQKRTKSFSINKYGDEEAKALAVAHRNRMIEELNEAGADYAPSHGSAK